jgi:integrase/recombinase XerD
VWIEGTLEGKFLRRSLKTRSWTRATVLLRELEDGGAAQKITITQATDSFLADAKARKLRPPSLYKYELLFRQLQEYAEKEGLRYLAELDIETVRRFRASWTNRNFAARVKTENLRSLFRFCVESNWLKTNPAKDLKSPQTTDSPTMPFTEGEMDAILKACGEYAGKNASLLRALVLLLRYSGLRIRDAVTLARDRIHGDTLFLYTQKTGVPVRIPLPPECTSALEQIPKGQYFFWTGEGLPKTRVANFQTMLAKVFDEAKILNGHAHRFRDTFATSLLLAGVPMERVSILLGHKSIRVTERHYSAWSAARQEQIESDVRRTWKNEASADAHTTA